MEDRIEKLFSEAKRLSLTADEKSMGREMLRSYMALKPMAVSAAVAARKPSFGMLRAWTTKAASAFSVALAVLLSAGSVSYAAEGALPGDLLYPVKVAVNEEVRAAVAVSAQAKGVWEAERAARRLDEAEQLAVRGRLRAETRAAIDVQFRGHAERAQKRIAALQESSDVEAAANVNAHLEGSLNAHKRIIAMLDDVDGELTASIDQAIGRAEEGRGRNEARVAAEASAEAKTAAQGRRNAASHKIAEVRGYIDAKGGKFGAEAAAEAKARLAEADATVAEGDAKLAAGEHSAAFAAFGKAQRQAQEAKSFLRAGHAFQYKAKSGANANAALNANANVNASLNMNVNVNAAGPAGGDDDEDEEEKRRGRGLELKTEIEIRGGDKDVHGAANADVKF